MVRERRIFVLLLLFGLCAAVECGRGRVVDVSACQLKADPPAYDHKVIRVTGFVSHGFEDFTLFDPQCPSWPGVWLEYGGRISSLTTYLGGGAPVRTRAKDLAVDGILVPLLVNNQFEKFDKAMQPPFRSGDHGTTLRATLIGRFFAGKKLEFFEGKPWGGFGHMSCCTLLAVQQVEESDTKNHSELDYDSSPDQPHFEKAGCGFRGLLTVDQSALLRWQREVDQGWHSWAVGDPLRVALDALSKAANFQIPSAVTLTLSRDAQGRKVYIWKPKSKGASYMVVVSRPYWLSFYARDPSRVAWVSIAAYESTCDQPTSVPRGQ